VKNDQRWWDEFWARQSVPPATRNATPDTWYDLVWHVTFEYWYECFGKHAPGKRMLECGCGSARVSQYMAQRGYQCTLLDNSEQALSIVRRNFEALSLDGEFVLGDITNICFGAGEFDVVYSGGVLEFQDDLGCAVKEMVRVLKPGGVFAANVVPPKFSIQSIADIERTVAYSLRNLMKGNFRDAFKRVRQIPSDYQVKTWSLNDYVRACKEAGLTAVEDFVTTPFPALALPKAAHKLYARAMKALLPQWRRFNESRSRWSELWGIGYAIYGIKRG